LITLNHIISLVIISQGIFSDKLMSASATKFVSKMLANDDYIINVVNGSGWD